MDNIDYVRNYYYYRKSDSDFTEWEDLSDKEKEAWRIDYEYYQDQLADEFLDEGWD